MAPTNAAQDRQPKDFRAHELRAANIYASNLEGVLNMGKSADGDDWMDLRSYIDGFRAPSIKVPNPDVAKFDRLMAYREASDEQERKLDKAWRAVCKYARHSDAAMSIFLHLPDNLEVQPFGGLSGGERLLDPTSQRERYMKMAEHADQLIAFLAARSRCDPFYQLLADQDNEAGWESRLPNSLDAKNIRAHVEAADSAWQFGIGHTIKRELLWLSHALKGANPHKWYLTKQPQATDAGQQTCAALVADLTRYLTKPQHQALAVLSNANLPAAKLNNEKIRAAWRPPEWWTVIKKAETVKKKKAD